MRSEQITAQALKNIDNDRYKLSLVVAKRADELSNGAKPLVEVCANAKFTDIALLEIAKGELKLEEILTRD